VSVLALLSLQASTAVDAGATGPPGGTSLSKALGKDAADVRRYWTPERMRQAQPLDLARRASASAGEVGESQRAPSLEPSPLTHAAVNRFELTDTTSYPARVHGRVFLTFPGQGGGDFACSGTVIGSPAGNVALSAGHCVFDAGFTDRWATNWMFIPGRHNGQSPFGQWVAASLASTPQWVAGEGGDSGIGYDEGMAVMQPNGGTQLEQAVGARGIAFNQPRQQLFRAFGYPAEQPPLEFTGERLFACDSPYGGDDSSVPPPRTMLIACDMTGGSSGGGWVIGDMFVNSLISYGYPLEPNDIYGPYFDSQAATLYQDVSGVGQCLGKQPTLVGTNGSDSLVGTSAPDVILGLGGDDRIESGDGDDVICAGAGDDTMAGGAGDDGLDGGAGSDSASFGRAIDANLAKGMAKGEGNDQLIAVENLNGSPGKDTLAGDSGSNALLGGAGRDLLRGGAGSDLLSGEQGSDTVRFDNRPRVVVSPRSARGQGRDRLKGIENLTGSDRADVLKGDKGPNRLRGRGGADRLKGRGGRDRLLGGGGTDSCDGGGGVDHAKHCESKHRL
jgi:V8-like Glu-specific endopeptidase